MLRRPAWSNFYFHALILLTEVFLLECTNFWCSKTNEIITEPICVFFSSYFPDCLHDTKVVTKIWMVLSLRIWSWRKNWPSFHNVLFCSLLIMNTDFSFNFHFFCFTNRFCCFLSHSGKMSCSFMCLGYFFYFSWFWVCFSFLCGGCGLSVWHWRYFSWSGFG